MNDKLIADTPLSFKKLEDKCREIGFTMPSDIHIGSLLKTLIASKPKANVLELGTGIGLSLSWMIEGLDTNAKITTIDNDSELTQIAQEFFGQDPRVQIICMDGSEWIQNYQGDAFDLIFADAWPGKYSDIDQTLNLLKVGGFYIIDDMNVQPNWPEGHEQNVNQLINYLENRQDLSLTKMCWSSGVIIASKLSN